jgi:hypothetical protein
LIALASPCPIDLGLLRPLFLLADFFVRICRAKALLALIFPVPVFLNRFAAPRLVFIFGTIFSPQKQNFPSPRGRGFTLLDKTPVGLQGSIKSLSNRVKRRGIITNTHPHPMHHVGCTTVLNLTWFRARPPPSRGRKR